MAQGTTIPITVTFSAPVTVTGNPQLTLNPGAPGTPGRGAVANYTSGSGTATLTFTYAVAAGQTTSDLDYTSTAALALNGGTIEDASNNAATLTLPATSTDGLANQDIAVGPFSEGFESGNFKEWPWQLSAAGSSPANWTVQSSIVHAGSLRRAIGPHRRIEQQYAEHHAHGGGWRRVLLLAEHVLGLRQRHLDLRDRWCCR